MSPKIKIKGLSFDAAAIKNLLHLHDKYIDECEYIAASVLQSCPEHDFFFNWLPCNGYREFAEIVGELEDKNVLFFNPANSCLYDQRSDKIILTKDQLNP